MNGICGGTGPLGVGLRQCTMQTGHGGGYHVHQEPDGTSWSWPVYSGSGRGALVHAEREARVSPPESAPFCATCETVLMVVCPWGGHDCPVCDKGHHDGPDWAEPFSNVRELRSQRWTS